MKMNKLALPVAGAMLLTACGTPWPIAPVYNRETLAKGADPVNRQTIDDVKRIGANWQEKLSAASRDRRQQEIVLSELAFYGTLLLTGGQALLAREVTDRAKYARNFGFGLAGGSSLLGAHYQPKDQRLAFTKASERMACLNTALSPVPKNEEMNAIRGDFSEAASDFDPAVLEGRYRSIPRQALEYIEEFVTPRLTAELADISLGAPSREQIKDAVKKLDEGTDTGNGMASLLYSPQMMAKNNKKTPPSPPPAPAMPAATQPPAAPGQQPTSTPPAPAPAASEPPRATSAQLTAEQVQARADAIAAITSFEGAVAICKTR